MLTNISRAQAIGAWLAVVVVTMAGSVVAGADLTGSAGELWLIAAVVPPVITLLLWHGPPPATVADVLYSTSRQNERNI